MSQKKMMESTTQWKHMAKRKWTQKKSGQDDVTVKLVDNC